MTVTVAPFREMEVVEAAVDAGLAGGTAAGPLGMVAPGRYLLTLPGVGRFLVEGGARVTVERAPGSTDADVACFLAGPVRQAGWLQRGRFALRGCGVVIGAGSVVITGGGGSGASTVAAALALRGHRLLADGAVPLSADGEPVADFADESAQLWPAAVRLLGLDPGAGTTIRPGLAKRRFAFAAASPTRLAAVVALHRHSDVGAPRSRAATGLAAAAVFTEHTALRPAVPVLAGAPAHFRWAVSMAAAVPVVDLCTDRHRSDVAAVADAVESIVAGRP